VNKYGPATPPRELQSLQPQLSGHSHTEHDIRLLMLNGLQELPVQIGKI